MHDLVSSTEPRRWTLATARIAAALVLAGATAPAQNWEGVTVSPGFVVEGRVVKGIPYSAHAVTSTRQTLTTGSEISTSFTAVVARDSEGRTRREQALLAIGGWAIERSESPTVVVIQDPVKMVNYTLDPRTHLARMNRQRTSAQLEESRRAENAQRSEAFSREPRSERTELLGAKTLEGFRVEGRRTITTYPVGSVRNSAPIEVVVETWYSSELQEVMLSKRTDPRFGETIYRLTDIKRAEPPASLFEVPSDYRVEAGEPRRNEREPRKEP
jgi:hypothetical protein